MDSQNRRSSLEWMAQSMALGFSGMYGSQGGSLGSSAPSSPGDTNYRRHLHKLHFTHHHEQVSLRNASPYHLGA